MGQGADFIGLESIMKFHFRGLWGLLCYFRIKSEILIKGLKG